MLVSITVPFHTQDIFKHCTEECITSVTDIPYFDGDFWPNVIEETIKELDQEAKQREASEKDTEVGLSLWWALIGILWARPLIGVRDSEVVFKLIMVCEVNILSHLASVWCNCAVTL